MNEFPLHTQAFFLAGPAGRLAVMTTYPAQNEKKIVGIICHPNPLFAGTMNNKVVTTIAQAFDRLGLKTVRFNFRGVGESEGSYGETIGETEDLLAVVEWVKQVLPDHEICLAGFSFGSYIAAKVANQMPIKQLVTVAPAVNMHAFAELTHITCPWLMVLAEADEIVPYAASKAFADHPVVPTTVIVMHEASHFFHRRLIDLREALINALRGSLK
jgi:alpha/beta superfamily hydrolase